MTPILVDQLPIEMWEEMKPIFREAFPNEAVVAIHGDKWRQLENISSRPAHMFELRPEDTAWLHRNPPDLFLHSHPSPPASQEPSDNDTIMQLKMGWNWGIVAVTGNLEGDVYNVAYPECWGDGIAIQPLVGRSYLWAVRDCWTLCRDWYRTNGYEIDNIPRSRDPDIYPVGHALHDQFAHFPKQIGFKQVARHERQKGDTALMMFRSANRYNHCGLYLGEGKYLHQLEGKTSEVWIPHNEEQIIERWNLIYWRPKQKPKPAD